MKNERDRIVEGGRGEEKGDFFFFFQAKDGIRDFCLSRGLGNVYKRQTQKKLTKTKQNKKTKKTQPLNKKKHKKKHKKKQTNKNKQNKQTQNTQQTHNKQ